MSSKKRHNVEVPDNVALKMFAILKVIGTDARNVILIKLSQETNHYLGSMIIRPKRNGYMLPY